MIWDVQDSTARAVLYGLFGFGFLLVLVATLLINHFDLFGLRQVWLNLRGREYTSLNFVTPGPYRLIRHPLYLGWLFAFWATPTMTVTHLLFAVMTTAYIFVAIQLEERDLIEAHPQYAEYKRRVPMMIPMPGEARARRGANRVHRRRSAHDVRPAVERARSKSLTRGRELESKSQRAGSGSPRGDRALQGRGRGRERGLSPAVRLRQRTTTRVRWAFTG